MNIHRIDNLKSSKEIPLSNHPNLDSRIAVVFDDKPVSLESMINWLNQALAFDVVCGNSNRSAVLDLVFELNPCLVILVIDEQFTDYELATEVASISSDSNIAYIARNLSTHKAMRVLNEENVSIVSLYDQKDEFLSLLHRVSNGEVCFSACIQDSAKPRPRSRDNPWNLSERQMQVLIHLAEGHTVKETASKLFLSPKSIDSHKYRIMKKLGLHDRVHLSRFAIREGLIDP